jgi:hypothetical protein
VLLAEAEGEAVAALVAVADAVLGRAVADAVLGWAVAAALGAAVAAVAVDALAEADAVAVVSVSAVSVAAGAAAPVCAFNGNTSPATAGTAWYVAKALSSGVASL